MRKYLVGLMCLLGVSALAQEKAISGADWQVSWTAFIRVIAPYYLNPKGPSDLRDRFEGTNVTWSGTVVRIDNTMAGKAFKIAMPPVSLKLLGGKEATLEALTLVPGTAEKNKWEPVATNQVVRFRTRLKGNPVFGLFDVIDFGDEVTDFANGSDKGRTVVAITTEGAELISSARP